MMNNEIPQVSIIISTRNRGASVVPMLELIFQTLYPNYEVILVDQSDRQDPEEAVKKFLSNPRFEFVPSKTQGLGLSRNIGLKLAQGSIVAYTDNDCTVPADWLARSWKVWKPIQEWACCLAPSSRSL